MSENKQLPTGTIGWHDLTVPDAEAVRDFYQKVIGWTFVPVEMDGYSDFAMLPPGADSAVAGICHARGPNAQIPPQWLVYFIVEDVDRSAADCERSGGEIVVPIREIGGGRFCVIRDPAGAVCALFSPEA